jgi:hypothetical protein
LAVKEHVPAETMVIVSPLTVQTPVVVDVSVGVNAELADGVAANGVVEKVF